MLPPSLIGAVYQHFSEEESRLSFAAKLLYKIPRIVTRSFLFAFFENALVFRLLFANYL